MKQEFTYTQYVARDLNLKNHSLLINSKTVKFSIDISEGMFKGLDASENPYINEFITVTNSKSAKTVFAINLEQSFEVYMIDMRGSKTQINLKQRMDHHLISSTRKAHIYSITDSGSLFTISTTNHNFMCFQWEDGAYVGVKSISLYN